MSKLDTIIATGGTGGHIFPAKSVAENLLSKGVKLQIFGDKKYLKYHKDSDNYQYKIISSSQLSSDFISLFKAAFKIGFGILQSLILLIYYRPKTIVTFGGYSTFPILIAAIILRKNIIIHEQNAHLGKVNRLFAKYVKIIALSYPETSGIAPELISKTKFTGNPIRQDILKLSENNYKLPDLNTSDFPNNSNNLGYDVLLASDFKNQNSQEGFFNILVLGGSGGAKIFSEILPKAFFNIRDEVKNNISITQQCRAESLESTFRQYKSFNLNITINAFFEDMAKIIEKTHLVIARSGSSSLSEFTAAKKPMILVPFAKAADNHQEKNARYVEKIGGAVVIPETEFTINKITNLIENFIDNPEILLKMSKHSFECAVLDATDNLSNTILTLLHTKR